MIHSNETVIRSVNGNQHGIIKDIISLHLPDGIDADVTYSKGVFYKDAPFNQPRLKFDLFPQTNDTVKSSADKLPVNDSALASIMFDPPFVVGGKKSDKSIIRERFSFFPNIKTLWAWYDLCIVEHFRCLKDGGVYIVKCQDTVNDGLQRLSHCRIMDKANEAGFYCKDLFILTAENRILGHKGKRQHHARKFHSYFLVFEKNTKGRKPHHNK